MSTDPKPKTPNYALTERSIASKDEYEKHKRKSKPISFNRDVDAIILDIADSFNFGVWVKTLLTALTPAEVTILKAEKNPSHVPALLVEQAIENGYFDLDEYLESKGQKIVDIKTNKKSAEYNFDEFNQCNEFDQSHQ